MLNTKDALLTFGGAYTVLPYFREQVVGRYHWIGDVQMMDALALGETTPGPLISIGVFLSYLAGNLPGAIVGCFFLFLPSFVLVLSFAPHIGWFERLPHARAVLWGFSAGTLGLILALTANLVPSSIPDSVSAAVAVAAFLAVSRTNASILLLVAAGGLIGLIRGFLG